MVFATRIHYRLPRLSNCKLPYFTKYNSTRTMATTNLVPPQKPIDWTTSVDRISSLTDDLIASINKVDDAIASEKSPNIKNTILKYAAHENVATATQLQLGFYNYVSADKELRNASTASEERIQEASIDSSFRVDVYDKIKKAYEDDSDGLLARDPETRLYAKKLELKYRRNGLALPEETRKKVLDLQKRLSNVCIKFNKQLGEENGHLEFTKHELEGLPESVFAQFETSEDGKYKMTFKYPDVTPVFKYAKNQETRKAAFAGFEDRGTAFNKELVKEAVEIRTELAQLLGYKTHADFVLEERMAKSAAAVEEFLTDLYEKCKDAGKREAEELLKLKNEDLKAQGLPAQDVLYSWDYQYYDNKLKEEKYKFDLEEISEYFPIDQTVDKMFDIFAKLFSLKFVKSEGNELKTWHEDVQQFEVWSTEKEENEFVGWLYLDMHPREGKYGHAANFSLVKSYVDENNNTVYPVTALVCNFSKSTPSRPSLLKHNEVTTLFHELGHGIHDLVGRSKFGALSGTSVEWDFVEAPSQMLEYWTWNKDQLVELSGHYKDPSKQLPDQLVDGLVASKNVNQGLFTLRQLFFGLFDFKIHTQSPESVKSLDLTKLWNELRESVTGLSLDGTYAAGYTSFGHIMGGYDSGYYGYMWSKVFSTDMYQSKFASQPMDITVGAEYRHKVIGKGGSKEASALLEDFLGRKPNNEAFLKELMGA